MRGLEDVEVVDGEPVAAYLIPRAVTAGELLLDDGATQTFEVGGDTSYIEADGRPTEGEWYVDDDGRFCSFRPPTYRACYDLRWIVKGDERAIWWSQVDHAGADDMLVLYLLDADFVTDAAARR